MGACAGGVDAANDAAQLAARDEGRARAQRLAAGLPAPAGAAHRTTSPASCRPSTAGCLRGLGRPVTPATRCCSPAWSDAGPAPTSSCRCTSRWTFSTGPVGDIETLARRLQHAGAVRRDADAAWRKLRHIGTAPVVGRRRPAAVRRRAARRRRCSKARWSRSTSTPRRRPKRTCAATSWRRSLNSGADARSTGQPRRRRACRRWRRRSTASTPRKRHTVERAEGRHALARRLDAAAALPARRRLGRRSRAPEPGRVHAGGVGRSSATCSRPSARSRSRALARDVLKRVEVRHLAKLPAERVLARAGAGARAHRRSRPAQSLYGRIGGDDAAHELFDGAMRRLASPRRADAQDGALARRALGLPSVAAQMAALVDRFANATRTSTRSIRTASCPTAFSAASRYDGVPLPGELDALVDLEPLHRPATSA